MIEKVSIRNFKSLRDVRVQLERFTVFVGPNASGKTSILQGLDLLCRIFRQPAHFNDSKISQWLSRGSEGGIDLAADLGGHSFRYRNQSRSPVSGPPIHPPQTVQQRGRPGRTGPAREEAVDLDSETWTPWNGAGQAPSPLPLSLLPRLEISKLIPPTAAAPDPTVMNSDGTGMHAALASMVLNDPDSWQRLQNDLRRIIPSIRRLRHTRTTPGQVPSVLFDTFGADDLPADHVSEGTLLILGLLTALHTLENPTVLLLDDLDRGLHPLAQRDLVELLRGLLETNPDLQIVATTHSPYLLDCMQPNEVRMTYLQDGSTLCAPLEDHPKFEKWKREMAPGEMWSLFGEKWLAEKKEAVA